MKKAILVVGGAGYVGSHACKALSAAGYAPVTFDNLSLGHEAFVKWGPLVKGDIRDTESLAQAITDHEVAAVLHFAALALVGESVAEPARYYNTNVAGTLSLLEAMRATGRDRLVFSSSCAIYGEPARMPISEATLPQPVNPYGASKLMCERMLQDFGAAYGLKSVALRYFNAAGADEDGEVGEFRAVETHLIPRALMALQGYVHDFTVFGADYPTPDGTAVRDYIHVADLADAHVLALQRLLGGGEGGAFNLGTGKGYSVGEVLREIAAVTGRGATAPKGPRRPGDPAELVADPSLARRELGFDPRRSDLRTIIDTAWRWHGKAHPAKNATPPGG